MYSETLREWADSVEQLSESSGARDTCRPSVALTSAPGESPIRTPSVGSRH